ncbi:MAG: enoyl-CoA hydratase/isomerase family protein [Syntrophales bacterium]
MPDDLLSKDSEEKTSRHREKDLLFLQDNGIATILLNRPRKKNSFTMEMIDLWVDALEVSRKDPEIKVIVVTGSGDSFCSGADLTGLPDVENCAVEHKNMLWEQIHRVALILEDIDKPVIAAVNGVAVGAGMDMALMCDLRFAADTASFSEGYVRIGVVPGDGGCYYLPRLVGIAKALELFWTGDFIDAGEALRIGMVNRVYPADKLIEETYRFARRLADGPGLAIRTTKRATYQSCRLDLRTALDLISSHVGVIRTSKDHHDAMKRMMAKLSK